MSRAYLCVSIDTECDKGRAWWAKRPMTFDGVHVGIVDRLRILLGFAQRASIPVIGLVDVPEILGA